MNPGMLEESSLHATSQVRLRGVRPLQDIVEADLVVGVAKCNLVFEIRKGVHATEPQVENAPGRGRRSDTRNGCRSIPCFGRKIAEGKRIALVEERAPGPQKGHECHQRGARESP